jgi:hypothetical protein
MATACSPSRELWESFQKDKLALVESDRYIPVEHFCRPLHGLSELVRACPRAHARGYTLSPVTQAKKGIFFSDLFFKEHQGMVKSINELLNQHFFQLSLTRHKHLCFRSVP